MTTSQRTTHQCTNEPFRICRNDPNSMAQQYFTGTSHATSSVAAAPSGRPIALTHELTARTCADHIIRLFASARHPPPAPSSRWQHYLPVYISGTLQRACEVRVMNSAGTCESVAVAAMTLLSRYKTLHPSSVAYDPDDAYQLFIASFSIAAKEVGSQGQERREMLGRWWAYVASEPDGRVKFTQEQLARLERSLRHALRGDVSINVAAVVRIKRGISRRRQRHLDSAGQNFIRHQDFTGEDEGDLNDDNGRDYYLDSREQVYIEVDLPNERNTRSPEDTAPPSYQDAARDMRIVETGAIGNTSSTRLYRTSQIPSHRSSPNLRVVGYGRRQPQQFLPPVASAGTADECEEDQVALARMLLNEPRTAPAPLSPLASIKQKIGGEGGTSLVAVVRKGVARLVHPLHTASRPGTTRRRSNTA